MDDVQHVGSRYQPDLFAMTHRQMVDSTWHPSLIMALLALLPLAAGCSVFSAEEESGGNAPLEPLSYESLAQSAVPIETIDQGAYGGDLVKGVRRVIRDDETFAMFWASLHGERGPTRPDVDFSEHMVLAVVLGERPTGGYQAEIASITRNTNPTLVRAFVTEIVPGADCAVTQATTVPYHIVRVDAVDLDPDQIVFPDNGTQTRSCDS